MEKTIILLFLIFSNLFASSLKDLLLSVSTNNLTLKQLISEEQATQYMFKANIASLWQPSLKLSSGISFTEEGNMTPNASVSLSKSINLGGSEWFSLKQNQLQQDLLAKKRSLTIATLKKEIVSTYFSFLSIAADVRAAEKDYELAIKKQEFYKMQYELGKIPLSTLQEYQSKSQQAYLTWQQKIQAHEESLLTLQNLTKMTNNDIVPTREEAETFLSNLVYEPTPPLFERDETYLSLTYTLSNTLLTKKIHEAKLWPDLGLQSGYQVKMNKDKLQGQWSTGVTISLDPFSWFPGTSSSLERARVQQDIHTLHIKLENQKMSLLQKLVLLEGQEKSARESLNFISLSLESATLQYQKAQEQFTMGKISSLDLLAAESFYLSTLAHYLSSLTSLLSIRIELAFWYDPSWDKLP
ncbi:TolC family protein [Thermospira aquatica]|uniref:TolC family protein n=1 Tax=Thermospira aquatica TaxID=2828656 RepID=A0AAX3BBU0_9SPIR|nr:TolC family protein [Thermospira aquatica]URA09715.1 TolC family protein [Thermospira aquatica]